MICNKCNKQVQDGVQFCPNCGNNLSGVVNNSTVAASTTNVVTSPQIINPVEAAPNVSMANVGGQVMPVQDKVNVWLVILSWFIPLAGLIIFFVKKKTSPKTAKASGLCALISFVLSLIVVIFVGMVAVGTVSNVIDKAKSDAEEITEEIFEDEDIEDDITNSSTNGSDVAVNADWKQYQFAVGEKVMTLPTTYNALSSATGFSFKEADINDTLKDGYYAAINMYKDGKLALNVEVLNDSGKEAKYTDCKITRISQTKYQLSQSGVAIVFPGGIKVGDTITEQQITNLFGTPSETKDYSSEGYASKKYNYFANMSWTTTNNFKLSVLNGVLDDIQLDNRNS